ncbi:MAG: TIGR00645 family protein [Rhodospirillales bacterium]|nr:TIGR00645 family protein [Rhodospirillales bacterium]
MRQKLIETALYASRWMLIPLFLGLTGVVILLTLEFYETLIFAFSNVFVLEKNSIIIIVLKLVDMAMIGSLVIMVAISGYENFVSRISVEDDGNKPTIFSRLDPGTIKIKLGMVIIAISSIHLLQVFIDIDSYTTSQVILQIAIHLAFVVSGIAVALIDKVLARKHKVGGY